MPVQRPATLAEPSELSDGAESDATDPAMPELIGVSPLVTPSKAPPSPGALPVWLPTDQPVPLQLPAEEEAGRRPSPEALDGEAAEAERALLQAEDLLRPPAAGPVLASEAKAKKLRAIALLQTAVSLGCDHTIEAAADALLAMLKNTDPALLAPALAGLQACRAFPAPLAGEAARLLMQKRAWPERGEALRGFCAAVASADPAAVLGACVDLVPRARAPQMLSFDWLLGPMAAVLSERQGDDLLRAVVLLCDDLKGPMSRAASAKELLRQLAADAGGQALRRLPQQGDLARKARSVQVAHWLDLYLPGG